MKKQRGLKLKKQRGLNRGMSLPEAVVGMAIAAFVLVGLLQVIYLNTFYLQDYKQKMVAINLINEKIELLKNTAYNNIVNETETVKLSLGATDAVEDDIEGTRAVMVIPALGLTAAKQLTISLSWMGLKRNLSEQLTTIITSE